MAGRGGESKQQNFPKRGHTRKQPLRRDFLRSSYKGSAPEERPSKVRASEEKFPKEQVSDEKGSEERSYCEILLAKLRTSLSRSSRL